MTLKMFLTIPSRIPRRINLLSFSGILRKSFGLSYSSATSYSNVYIQKPYAYAYGKSPHNLEHRTVGEVLKDRALTDGGKTAVISEHESLSITFGQLDSEVDNLMYAFNHELGLRPGDVVALWTSNCYNSILIQYACARYGLIMCTLNPVYKNAELEFGLQKSEAKAIFLPGSGSNQEKVNTFTHILSQLDVNHLSLNHVVYLDGDASVNIPGLKSHSLKDLVDHSKPEASSSRHLSADDPSIIMFTSGTTGKPKGAVLTHHNMVNNASLTAHRLGLRSPGTISCIPVPLFHVFGMVYGTIMMSTIGMPIVLTGYRYNVKSVVNALNKHKCSHIMMVPAMSVDILNYVESQKISLPSLETVITGSAPTPVEVAKNFLKSVPSVKNFLIRYGSTETGGCMSMPFPGETSAETIDNVGKPLDLVEIKIVDPKTRELKKINEQGELWARGHNVMYGYWKDEEKTKEAVTEKGWFKSGDMATMDEEGRVKLVGRTKEMIIRGGENVYPMEIEDLLHRHPAVYAAAVCGVPDKRMGEEICAWIKLKDGAKTSPEEIKEFCKEKISYFKIPRHVLIVDSFPSTPTGKPQKHRMREETCKKLGLVEL